MPRRLTGQQRQHRIYVRLDNAELAELHDVAASTGMTSAEYLRAISTRRPVRAVADLDSRACGDLGRLGGLFKLWLARNALGPGVARLDAKRICDTMEPRLCALEAVMFSILQIPMARDRPARRKSTASPRSNLVA
jgi:hypothetical protein